MGQVTPASISSENATDDDRLKRLFLEAEDGIRDARFGIGDFLCQTPENHVYWVERTGRTGQYLSLNAAPVDMSAALQRLLFAEERLCIMTSATLSVGSPDLSYFRYRVGAM